MAQEVIKVSALLLQQMKEFYRDYLVAAVPHSEFCASMPTVKITAYTSGKVLFQGSNISTEVSRWQKSGELTEKKLPKSSIQKDGNLPSNFANWTIMGSDEVGNGSYFGALTVCAVYLDTKLQQLVQRLGIKDSKELSDQQICHLAEQLKELVPYHLTVCPPMKYNEANQTHNANGIKAILHNFTLLKLRAKLTLAQQENLQGVLIDQFVAESGYYRHLANESQVYRENVYFAQKGEGKHLAVACASIIARAAFLDSLVALGKPYGIILPSGAGTMVDVVGRQLVQRYGEDILPSIAKMHFANTKKILMKS